jgi:phthiocerol/phenolphthiocerol synthesis type-I polyketide synthase E
LEIALAKLWKRVLGRLQIGIDDNFFDLGGTSLKAVQVIALIQRELGRNLSITSLFECPTIHLLARKLAGPSNGSGNSPGAKDAQMRGRRRRYLRVRRRAT